MRILHIVGIGHLPREPERDAAGGLAHVVFEVARLQAARGHRVVVAAVRRARWFATWHGVLLASLAAMPRLRLKVGGRKLDLSTLLPLIRFAALRRFDVIHAHEYNYLRYLPAGVRLTHFHNDPCRFPSGHAIAAWEARECLAAARYSHAHVAVSQFIAGQLCQKYESIAEHLPAGFDAASRTYVVHNGVDFDRFDPGKRVDERRRLRRAWGVGDDDLVFLYSGAIAPEKGVLHLARAFAALARGTPRVRLVLAGDAALWDEDGAPASSNREHASYQQAVYDCLAELADRRQVVRLGLTAPEAMPGTYAAADVVVVPSIVQEAFCLAAAEGLAMGKPVVACAVGGLLEFANGENSVLVPPGDEEALLRGLRLLAEDDTRRARLGGIARRSVSALTWVRAERQLEDLYQDLLARRSSIICAKPPVFYRF